MFRESDCKWASLNSVRGDEDVFSSSSGLCIILLSGPSWAYHSDFRTWSVKFCSLEGWQCECEPMGHLSASPLSVPGNPTGMMHDQQTIRPLTKSSSSVLVPLYVVHKLPKLCLLTNKWIYGAKEVVFGVWPQTSAQLLLDWSDLITDVTVAVANRAANMTPTNQETTGMDVSKQFSDRCRQSLHFAMLLWQTPKKTFELLQFWSIICLLV